MLPRGQLSWYATRWRAAAEPARRPTGPARGCRRRGRRTPAWLRPARPARLRAPRPARRRAAPGSRQPPEEQRRQRAADEEERSAERRRTRRSPRPPSSRCRAATRARRRPCAAAPRREPRRTCRRRPRDGRSVAGSGGTRMTLGEASDRGLLDDAVRGAERRPCTPVRTPARPLRGRRGAVSSPCVCAPSEMSSTDAGGPRSRARPWAPPGSRAGRGRSASLSDVPSPGCELVDRLARRSRGRSSGRRRRARWSRT